MKLKKLLMTLLLGFALAGLNATAQVEIPDVMDMGDETEAADALPELTVEIKAQIQELRENRGQLRDSFKALLAELEGAPEEEIEAAIEAWREENAEAIEAARDLALAIRDQMEGLRPDRPEPPELPAAVQELIDAFRAGQAALQEERKAIVEENEDDPEALEAALEAWREENADRLAAQRELGNNIREAIKALLPPRPPRPEPPVEIQQLREEFKAKRGEIQNLQAAFREEIKNAAEEDKEAAADEFKAQIRDLMQEKMELKRQLREAERTPAGERRGQDE